MTAKRSHKPKPSLSPPSRAGPRPGRLRRRAVAGRQHRAGAAAAAAADLPDRRRRKAAPAPAPRTARQAAPIHSPRCRRTRSSTCAAFGRAGRRAARCRRSPKPTRSASRARAACRPHPPSREITASIGPFPTQDRVPADVALAYAAQADGRITQARATAPGRRHQRGTASIASKPSEAIAQQPPDAGRRAPRRSLAARPGAGAERAEFAGRHAGRRSGFRRPGPVHEKPASSVMMTFSSDPHLGMTTDSSPAAPWCSRRR